MSNKQKIYIFVLILIFVLGAFLRMYHFSDWLHFELDQARDAKVIDLAYTEGVNNLPLLGPKAAGSFLRLGPIFYYFKYLSALIFGDTPAGMAVIIMLFGILALPVFYLFIRKYFSRKIALGLFLLFATSLFLVMYSRFSWNPNALPFFTLLTFYFLLRTAEENEPKKGVWLIGTATSLAIATQLHFLAFIAVPIIVAIYLIIRRPRLNWKYWLASVLVILFLYSPVFINEFMTGGDNVKEFFKATEKKSSKDDHTILEKMVKSYNENALGYFIILSGQEQAEIPRLVQNGTFNFDIKCDNTCKARFPWGVAAFVFFTSGWVLVLRTYFKEKENRKKNFTLLILIWGMAAALLFVPVAFSIAPRFFLLTAALPLVFLGYIWEFLKEKLSSRITLVLIIVICIALAVSNLVKIRERFNQMASAPERSFSIPADKVLKERNRVTLEQQYLILDFIKEKYAENGYPIYLASDPFYSRALLYHVNREGIPSADFKNLKKVYARGNYFLVLPTDSNVEKDLLKYGQKYELKETKIFGTLTVFVFFPKAGAINAEIQIFLPTEKPKSSPGVPIRYRWEEIFSEAETEE